MKHSSLKTPGNPRKSPFLRIGTIFAMHSTEQRPSCGKTFQQRGTTTMIKPLADRVLIEPAPAEEKTVSGLYIPDNAKEKPMQGTVVAAGPGKKDESGKTIAMDVKVGDKVLYGKYSGTEVTVDGKEYLIVRESDIFAIL